MHPILSIGVYSLMQLVVFLLTVWCLKKNPVFKLPAQVLRRIGFAAGLFFWLFSLLPILGAMLPESAVKYSMQGIGNIWLGFTIYFNGLMIFLCAAALVIHLINVCVRKVKAKRQNPANPSSAADYLPLADGSGGYSKSRMRMGMGRAWIFALSLAAGAGLLVYGMIHAQNTIVTNLDVTIPKKTEGVSDLKIILIGDLHLSVNSHLSTIEKMVDRINQEDPDAVLIAGDIFTSSYKALKDPDRYSEALSKLKTKYGVFAVYGNHDVEETLFGGFPISPISQAFRTREMETFFADCNFQVLYDEMVPIAGGAVQIVGRVDGEKAGDGTARRKTPEQVLEGIDPEKPVIVLQHEPVEFAALKENGADLALCGHTHAGQLFPGNWIIPFFNENAYGWKKVAGLDTIVTSGIGYYGPPMRVGTDSEIMVINVHFS